MKKSKTQIIPYISFGTLSIVYGFMIYYLLPLSMLSFNMELILNVFFYILMGLLLGLVIFAVNAQRPCEILLTHLIFFWETKSMKLMILNNLKVHTSRNRLTSSIFSMAIAFIIFMLVQY